MDDKNKKRELPESFRANTFKKGRPKHPDSGMRGKRLSTVLKELLQSNIKVKDPLTGQERIMTANERIALGLVHRAIQGNLSAIKIIFERVEGAAQSITELEQSGLETHKTHDLAKLTTDELENLEHLLTKAETQLLPQENGEDEFLEIDAVEVTTEILEDDPE